jgi:acetyl-CoA acetyltransferase family protein
VRTIREDEAVIVEAVRTPIGRKNGVFASTRPDELGAAVLVELVNRTGINPEEIEEVLTGCAVQTNEQGFNISRNIILLSGLPIKISGTSLNIHCGSGLQAVCLAYATVSAGFKDIACGLGTESMTRVQLGMDGAGAIHPAIQDRFGIIPQGLSAELVAEKWNFTREELDLFSYTSHQRALAAVEAGLFNREIVPVKVGENGNSREITQDETPRKDTSLARMASLKPAFRPDGVITAGNSSQISDGAAGVMIMNRTKAAEVGLAARARIVSMATIGSDPTIMLTGPGPAAMRALEKAGLSIEDMDVIEVNEAFAPVPLAFCHEMGIGPERINRRGGAIALGHPLGSTGARLVASALHALEDEGGRYGLITLCTALGQAVCAIIERLG